MSSKAQKQPDIRGLESWLRTERENGGWVDVPLPTTRELGRRFGMAHTTAFRILCRLEREGLFWKSRTGRFFHSSAEERLARRGPIACLFRRIETWSRVYQAIMSGVAEVCDEARAATLLWHDVKLVRHGDPAQPPVFAGEREQLEVMQAFLERCGTTVDGVILDHLWVPSVESLLRRHKLPVVTVYRPAAEPDGAGEAAADFPAGATAALAHLLGRGYESLHWVMPFEGDSAVDLMKTAFVDRAAALGIRSRIGEVLDGSTPAARENLVRTIAAKSKRVGLFCPEDNVAVLVRDALRGRGIRVPDRVGLLAGMGTGTAQEAGIASVRYDFVQMGREAARQLITGSPDRRRLAPTLEPGDTT